MVRICRKCGGVFDAKHGEKLCSRCNPTHEPFPPAPIDLVEQWS